MYDHLCPLMANGYGKPNMPKENCVSRVESRQPDCVRCPDAFSRSYPIPPKGYVKKVKAAPEEPKERKCECGADIKKHRTFCDDCRKKKRVALQKEYRANAKRKKN